jgi:cytochrome c oxidase subunit 3
VSTRRTIDVSHLPTMAFGHRDPLWWGVVGMIAIESTFFVLLFATYFYIRGNDTHWPPSGIPSFSQVLAAINVAVLVVSCLPIHWANKSALKRSIPGMRWGLVLASALGVAFFFIRLVEFNHVGFRWDSHAYGSVFFTIIGLHTLHTIAATLENLILAALLFIGPVEEKHLVDVRVNGMYWYFVVGSWVPTYAILFLDPGVFRA